MQPASVRSGTELRPAYESPAKLWGIVRLGVLAFLVLSLGSCTLEFDHSLLEKNGGGCTDGVTTLPGDTAAACGKNGGACQQCVSPKSVCEGGECVVESAVVALSLGEVTSGAVDRNGVIWLWGSNQSSALGQPFATTQEIDTPVTLAAQDLVWSRVSMGGGSPELHTCAITTARDLYCWGSNGDGQCGIGTQDPGEIPTRVGTDSDWIAIGTGRAYSCGLRAPGALYCWGYASDSLRLGLSGTPTAPNTPEHVPGSDDWAKLSVGMNHSCAIKQDASLWCWGENGSGELGHPGNAPPAQVSNGTSYREVSAGGKHTCGIRLNGTLWCWGDNSLGQLGVGQSASEPIQVGADTDWISIAAGDRHTCGAHASGALECWGANDYGQVGIGSFDPAPAPSVVSGTAWTKVAAGVDHSCGVQHDGTLWCWGRNNVGQLGIPNPTFLPAPEPQSTLLE